MKINGKLILLTGGTDVNPALYGEAPHPETQPADDGRDALEIRLLKQALEINLPVLAICRGMQLFNVVHGGTLIQHLDNRSHEKRKDLPVSADNHSAVAPREMAGATSLRASSSSSSTDAATTAVSASHSMRLSKKCRLKAEPVSARRAMQTFKGISRPAEFAPPDDSK